MLIIDEKLLEIDELIDQVVSEFLKLPEVARYRQAREIFENDEVLQKKISVSRDNAEFANFRPELKALQREINLDEKVYGLRLAENDLQEILSALTETLANAISENIFIDENLPLKGGSRHDRHHRKDGTK